MRNKIESASPLALLPLAFKVYRGNYDVWSWVLRLELRITGPIESGSQLYAEFSIPGTGP